jgi:hypothetical protein
MTDSPLAYLSGSPLCPIDRSSLRVGSVIDVDTPGQLVGQHVDAGLVTAHDGGRGWPIMMYEVEPLDVAETMPSFFTVRSYRVVRDVPLTEVFGERAHELAVLMDRIGMFTWLAPEVAVGEEHLADLVEAHYVALSSFSPLEVLRVRLVTTWGEAEAASHAVVEEAERERSPAVGSRALALAAAHHAVEIGAGDLSRLNAAGRARDAPAWRACQPAWRAAFRVASIAFLAKLRRKVEMARCDLRAASDLCLGGAAVFLPTVEHAREPCLRMPRFGGVEEAFKTDVRPVLAQAWSFTVGAMGAVSLAAECLVELPDQPNPWLPVVSLLGLGVWPIGEVDGRFVVYRPPASTDLPGWIVPRR